MIELKPGVRVLGLTVPLLLVIQVAEGIWTGESKTLVITSAMDGTHTNGSAHYRGQAVDFRTNTLPPERVKPVIAALRTALGPDFFVLYEGEGTSNAHAHVEYRPQEAY